MPRKNRYDREKRQNEQRLIKDIPSREVRRAKTPEAKERRTVKELARTYTEDALEHLAKIMRKSKYPGLQLQAIEQILNRGWGKPSNSLTGEGGEGPVLVDIGEIRRTIVDPAADNDDNEPVAPVSMKVRSIEGLPRADMPTIKRRVVAMNERKK